MTTVAVLPLLAAQASAGSGWLGVLLIVAICVLTLLLLVLVFVLVPTIWSLRKTSDEALKLIAMLSRETGPVAQHVHRIADNAEYITTAVRADLHQLSRTLQDANTRLARAIEASERRVRELGALAGFAQEEAEQAVVSAAAALRGVRAGTRAFAGRRRDGLASTAGDRGGRGDGRRDERTAPARGPRIRRQRSEHDAR